MKESLRFNFWALLYIKPLTIYNFIFPAFNCRGVPQFESVSHILRGPKYDGKYLHWILREKLGETRLGKTLTNVVISTFDIKLLQPTIFSSYEVSLSLSLSVRARAWSEVKLSGKFVLHAWILDFFFQCC
jgi:hypothetical protein